MTHGRAAVYRDTGEVASVDAAAHLFAEIQVRRPPPRAELVELRVGPNAFAKRNQLTGRDRVGPRHTRAQIRLSVEALHDGAQRVGHHRVGLAERRRNVLQIGLLDANDGLRHQSLPLLVHRHMRVLRHASRGHHVGCRR